LTVRRTLLAVACLAIVAAAGTAVPVGRSGASSTGYSVRLTITGAGTVILETRRRGCNLLCHFKVRARRGCSSLCHFTVKTGTGTQLRLVAAPATSWRFASWRGCTLEPQATVCHLRLPHTGRVTATFGAPGSRQNPYPLGTAATLYQWRFKVNSATINADAEVEAYGNLPPAAGAQYTLVNVTATYLGGGSGSISFWLTQEEDMVALGASNAEYGFSPQCGPLADQVFSGQSVTGNLCFEIASNDASTLLLNGSLNKYDLYQNIWFALR
jgi:hypothetical protein